MKKMFVFAAILAGAVLFASCDNLIQDLVSGFTGKAKSIIGSTENGNTPLEHEYTSSVIVFDTANPPKYAVSLSMVMGIEELLKISSEDELRFPFLLYRLVGDSIKEGVTFMVNNTLTNEDLKDFDYESLISGEFAENQLVGIAVSPTLFYVMHEGKITLSEVTDKKVTGTFTGTAYVIDLDASPLLSDDLVPMSGDFSSRVTDLLSWLLSKSENV